MIKDRCFDRQFYLEILNKRVAGMLEGYRQNIAIIGDEFVGKTSIIHKFLNGFYDNRVITLYLEIRHESLNSFARRFIGVLLYNFLIKSGVPLKEDLDFLIRKSEKYIPTTVKKIKDILSAISKRRKHNIFTELLGLCDSLYQETGKASVLVFDEFHNLESLEIESLYREWSRLLIAQKNTMYIIASSAKFRTHQILSKNLSLLFGNFEVISVEPFDICTSDKFLRQRLEDKILDAASRNFIIHFTGGFPLYLEVISEAINKHAQNNLSEILEDLLFEPSGVLNQRFINFIKRFQDISHNNDYISILYLISSGRNKVKDIACLLKKQKKELDLRINKLLELDTVSRSGDFLKINDRVLAFWIKFVYQEKMQSLSFDDKGQKAKFRDQILEMIDEFKQHAQKPVIERLRDVLYLFEDDLYQFERKKIRLNHFREIKPVEFNNRLIKQGIIGRSNDSLWIMAFKQDLLTEEDIAEFSRECKKYRHNKLQRKVIVTLKEIDANTRLRALEEKIWAWDINNLNQFLDLYSKPWVIA